MMRLVRVPFWWPTTQVPSLGWDCGASFIELNGVAPKHEPAEEQHVGKRDNRADRCDRIADRMPRVHQGHANGQDHGAANPNPDLHGRGPATVQCRVQMIEYAK